MPHTTATLPADDILARFLLPAAGVRGAWVSLGPAWRELHDHGAPHAALLPLLGEAVAASALLTAQVKVAGRLTLQLRSHGALSTLFAEATAHGSLRGLVRGDGAAVAGADLRVLAPDGVLAVTIENPGARGDDARYQGLVPLVGEHLAVAFEDYFARSEQLPTRLLLAADAQRARGLLLQQLPADSGDADGWNRCQALFDTLGAGELLATPGEVLLHRLFHDEQPVVLGQRALRFACSCSRERVADVLRALGPAEASAALQADGVVEVHCEFCGQGYRFDRPALDALFSLPAATASAAGAGRLQ